MKTFLTFQKLRMTRWIATAFLVAGTWANLEGAVVIRVKYNDQWFPVVDARRTSPVILVDGKKRTVSDPEYRFHPSEGQVYAGAFLKVRNLTLQPRSTQLPDGALINPKLFFTAEIKASAPVEDCYVGLDIAPEGFDPGIVVYEIRNLRQDQWKKVSFNIPILAVLGRGKVREFFFTHGQQILPEHEFEQWLSRKSSYPTARSAKKDSPPKVIAFFSPGFPEELMGIIKEGSVKLEFSIGTDGQAKNIEIVESSHTAFESPAIEAITKTRFSPAVRNGQVTEIRLSQILTFTDPSDKKE